AAGKLERSVREGHLVMMDRIGTLRRRRSISGPSIFQIQLRLLDPDALLDRVMPYIGWWWAPWCVAAAVAAMAAALGFLFWHWDLYWSGFFRMVDPRGQSPAAFAGVLLLVFAVSIWHELGHGLTCKRFGGEVHDIGLMLFYGEPAFYCNVDDSYLFERRAHRVWVACGGAYFETTLCAGAVGTWLLTPAESTLHALAMSIVFVTGLSVLFNVNPLIKLDGYYALMDWLDVPDLRERSFRHLGVVLRRWLRLGAGDDEPIPARRRRIYTVYGTCALAYTTLVLVVLGRTARGWLQGWLGPAGDAVVVVAIAYVMRAKLATAIRFSRHFWLDKRELLASYRVAVGLAAMTIAALLVVPWYRPRIDAPFVVEPGSSIVLHAPASGWVRSVEVAEGERVVAGTPLARLESVETRGARDRDAAARAAARLRVRSELGDPTRVIDAVEAARVTEARLRWRQVAVAAMLLRAPAAGTVATADPGDLEQRFVPRGTEILRLDRLDTVVLSIAVPESAAARVTFGAPVRILAAACPERPMRACVLRVAPVATEAEPDRLDVVCRVNLVSVKVEIANDGALLAPGMTGRAQILGQRCSMVVASWSAVRSMAVAMVW
ncbi:MAG: efflux RND transporter periplasmic adaptor subunit, partial [Acidobacteriota bacterium]